MRVYLNFLNPCLKIEFKFTNFCHKFNKFNQNLNFLCYNALFITQSKKDNNGKSQKR